KSTCVDSMQKQRLCSTFQYWTIWKRRNKFAEGGFAVPSSSNRGHDYSVITFLLVYKDSDFNTL
ncbi:MAG: hypothetical protein H7308_11220, partial [Chthonomonadaceae bacterium]|nr:hypothetical protein [Chthonomonadaceae bacterium]